MFLAWTSTPLADEQPDRKGTFLAELTGRFPSCHPALRGAPRLEPPDSGEG